MHITDMEAHVIEINTDPAEHTGRSFRRSNSANRAKDFEEENAGWFILAGIIFTVVFIFTVLAVVNLVVA